MKLKKSVKLNKTKLIKPLKTAKRVLMVKTIKKNILKKKIETVKSKAVLVRIVNIPAIKVPKVTKLKAKSVSKKKLVAKKVTKQATIVPKVEAVELYTIAPAVTVDNLSVANSLDLNEFLLTESSENYSDEQFSAVGNKAYDLQAAILEYSEQKEVNLFQAEAVSDDQILPSSQPVIRISNHDNNIRSAHLVNLGTSKITKNEEVVLKPTNATPIFEQPKKAFNFKKRNYNFSKWFTKSENSNTQSYLSSNLKLKMVLQFTAIILLIILPLRVLHVYNALGETKNQVLGVTELGVEGMKNAATALSQSSWGNAISDFSQASDSFNSAHSVLQQINVTSLTLAKNLPIVGSTFDSAQKLLDVGKTAADLAVQITKILEQLNSGNAKDLTEKISIIKQGLSDAKVNIEKIDALLKDIDPKSVPEEYRPQLELILSNLPLVEKAYSDIDAFINFTEKVMGFDQEKRYIFIFQNNNELRATGGFMGSFALVDVKNGKISNVEIPGGGFYDLKASFFEKIGAPSPLHLVGYPWGVWDANWWPDFALSAKKIQWFLEKSRWPTVDGVISFNAGMIPNLIKLTGDIDLPQYDKHLTADNVILALQHAVEFEYDKVENKPKRIIGDMMPILIERLFKASENQPLPLILTLHQSLKNRDIQMYFNDAELQTFVNKQDWSGEQKQDSGDYLMVVNTNIAGGKTDGIINQHESVYTYLQDDGSVVHTVAITRTHKGNPTDVFERLNNVSYIRIYVPENSQLIEVSGQNKPGDEYFKETLTGYSNDQYLMTTETDKSVDEKTGTDIYKENRKQVFGNWLQVEPGQSTTLTFSYRVPASNEQISKWQTWLNKLTNKWHSYQSYSLYWQRQSGNNASFEHQLFVPQDKNIIWNDSSGQQQAIQDNKLITTGELNFDVIIAAIFGNS